MEEAVRRGRSRGGFGAQSPLSSSPRKAVFGWLVTAGYRKKSRKLRYCKQACISEFRLFFCAFHARDHALRDRPAVIVGWLHPRGRRFAAAKRAGGKNARCDALSRSFFRRKTAAPTAQPNTAAVRTAQPSGFAKQTEKERRRSWNRAKSNS